MSADVIDEHSDFVASASALSCPQASGRWRVYADL
jgi:hypothetical protein